MLWLLVRKLHFGLDWDESWNLSTWLDCPRELKTSFAVSSAPIVIDSPAPDRPVFLVHHLYNGVYLVRILDGLRLSPIDIVYPVRGELQARKGDRETEEEMRLIRQDLIPMCILVTFISQRPAGSFDSGWIYHTHRVKPDINRLPTWCHPFNMRILRSHNPHGANWTVPRTDYVPFFIPIKSTEMA